MLKMTEYKQNKGAWHKVKADNFTAKALYYNWHNDLKVSDTDALQYPSVNRLITSAKQTILKQEHIYWLHNCTQHTTHTYRRGLLVN